MNGVALSMAGLYTRRMSKDERKNEHKGERIAKVMARAGLASRRQAEQWIAAGRVSVNGAVISSPALNVTPQDQIAVDGTPLRARERTRLFRYHKLRGLMTTHSDPEGRPTIFAALPKNLPRLISVGRLDYNTEGLLLLTNDGALARAARIAADRLGAALSRARARPHHAGQARHAQGRRHHRRHPLRRHRGDARPRTGRQCLAHLHDQGRQEPRGAQCAAASRPAGKPADPRRFRPVRTGQARRWRGRGSANRHIARDVRPVDRKSIWRGFRRAGAGS